jgi:hypothetical protein
MKEKMIEKMIGKQIGKMTERVRMGLNKTHFRRKQFWDVNAALLHVDRDGIFFEIFFFAKSQRFFLEIFDHVRVHDINFRVC